MVWKLSNVDVCSLCWGIGHPFEFIYFKNFFELFRCIYCLVKGKSALRWDNSSIRSEFLILGFGNIVLSLVAHIAIFSECSWIHTSIIIWLNLIRCWCLWSACHLYILITVSAIYRQPVRASWIWGFGMVLWQVINWGIGHPFDSFWLIRGNTA